MKREPKIPYKSTETPWFSLFAFMLEWLFFRFFFVTNRMFVYNLDCLLAPSQIMCIFCSSIPKLVQLNPMCNLFCALTLQRVPFTKFIRHQSMCHEKLVFIDYHQLMTNKRYNLFSITTLFTRLFMLIYLVYNEFGIFPLSRLYHSTDHIVLKLMQTNKLWQSHREWFTRYAFFSLYRSGPKEYIQN